MATRCLALDSQLPTVRILDLGLALFGSASGAVDELTTVGQLMGTLDYMAPEQADNSHAVDARADVYSLGATLFKLLTGTAPYETPDRRSPLQKMKAIATVDPPPVTSCREDLPPELAAVVDRLLLRDPEARFQSAAEVATALTPFCAASEIAGLVERGLQLAELQREARERQLQSSHLAPRDEPPAVATSNNRSPSHAVPASDPRSVSGNAQPAQQNGSSRGARWRLWTALTAVALLAGITIWIQTDTGTLKIECADENVPIEIRNSRGMVVKQETLSVGQNEIVIRSGSYEIVLPKHDHELMVENGKYELSRGGEWLARVTKQPHSGSALRAESPGVATSSRDIAVAELQPGRRAEATESRATLDRTAASLVYSGRTFEQWQQSVLTERNPEELKNAVMALCILGRQNRDREAAETVLKVTDAYPCEIAGSPEGELIAAAIRYLRTLDADAIVPAIVDAVKVRGTNTRRVIVEHLAAGVMYGHVGGGAGGGAGISIPNTGKAEPLMSRLVSSPEYRKTLVELFRKLGHDDPETATLRLVAFQQIEAFLDDATLKAEIDALLEHVYENAKTTTHPVNRGSYVSKAILHLTRRSPRPELAAYFLDNLERTYLNVRDDVRAAWLPSLSSDWYGLWLLGDKAAGESNRIAKLLTAKLPGTYHPSPVHVTMVPTTPAGWGDTNSPRQSVTRKVLVLDLLATIGPGAKSAVPAVIDEIEALTGQRPVNDGTYGYEANDPRTFFGQYEAPFSHGLTGTSSTFGGFGGGEVPGTGGGFFSVSDVGPDVRNREPIVMPEPWLRLNAALRALKSLTGKTPRFTTLQLGVKQPDNEVSKQAEANPYAGGYEPLSYNSAQQGQTKNKDYDFGHAYGNGWVPKLVSYRGKHFDEWAETDLTNLSASELSHVQRGIELVGGYEPGASADAFARIFDTAMRLPGEVPDADRKVIHDAFLNCWLSKDGPARGKLLQAIFGGTPERTALVLTEIVAPSIDLTKPQPATGLSSEPPAPLNIEWMMPSEITRELIFAGPFGARYQNLVDGWDEHGPQLRAAILHVEAQLPALKQVNRMDLLQKVIDGGSPQEKLAAALVVARIDLSKQKDAPPRARNRDKTFAETPALKQSLKRAAIEALVEAIRERRDDVDWVNAVPALLTLQHGKLDDRLALEFAELIKADGSSPESIGPFSLLVNPAVPFDGKGHGGDDYNSGFGEIPRAPAYSGMGAATQYGGGSGEVSGGSLGTPGAIGLGSGGIPGSDEYAGGGSVPAKQRPPIRYILSRRILLCDLLSFAMPQDAELRSKLTQVLSGSPEAGKDASPLPEDLMTRDTLELAASSTGIVVNYSNHGATFRGRGSAQTDAESKAFATTVARTLRRLLPANAEK